jgi:hypothetical protein
VAYEYRGLVRHDGHDDRGAIADYMMALRIDQIGARLYHADGALARAAIGDTAGAWADMTRAQEEAPSDPYVQGLTLALAGGWTDAVAFLRARRGTVGAAPLPVAAQEAHYYALRELGL